MSRKIVKMPDERARKEGKPMAANEKEQSKVVVRDEKGNSYTLEFNARVVKNMERRGFKIDADFPVTMIEDLFLGAFQMHHKGILPDRAKEIWKYQSGKDELLSVLTKLYMKPLEEMMHDEKDGEEENENPTWEVV